MISGSEWTIAWIPGTLISVFIFESVFFAPVAALICGLIAYSKGLRNPLRYAAAGFVSCITFFVPFIYLVIRMSGGRISRGFIVAGYAAVYTLWFISLQLLCTFFLYLNIWKIKDDLQSIRNILIVVVSFGIVSFAHWIWIKSLRETIRTRGSEWEEDIVEVANPAPVTRAFRSLLFVVVAGVIVLFIAAGWVL